MEFTTQTSRPAGLKRTLLWGAMAAIVYSTAANSSFAQPPVRTASRARYVDDLVKRLMDSETDRRAILDSTVPDYTYDSAASARMTSPTREMVQVRRYLDDFADESSNLTAALDVERDRLPAVRQYFSESLKIRASAYLLSQRADKVYDHRSLIRDYSTIDQDFRLLSYNLRQVRGLSRNVAQPVIRMEQLDKSISELLQIKPQIDRQTLLQKSAALESSLRHLLDEIEIELDQSVDTRQLMLDGRRVHQQSQHVSHTIADRADHATVVSEYQQFLTLWSAYEKRLRPHQNRYLERSLRRIDTTNHDIKELLWIPHTVDRSELLHLTSTLKRDVDTFFERAPLKLLITLKNTQQVLAVADEFYGVCEYFTQNVESGSNHADMVDAFRYVDDSWKGFHATFDSLQSQKAHLVLKDIEAGIRSLREELKINDRFDRKAAVELAAAVDNLARHLSDDVDRWTAGRNTQLAQVARRDTSRFAAEARKLHSNAVNGGNVGQLAQECEALFSNWGQLHTYIPQAPEKDREHLQRVSARLTPYLVDLRTMLAAYQ